MIFPQLLRRPLVGIALSIAGGIYLASYGWIDIDVAALLAAVFVVLGFLLQKKRPSGWIVFAAVALVSAVRFFLVDPGFSSTSVERYAQELPKPNMEVVGQVYGTPKFYLFKTGDLGMWVFPVRIEGVKESGAWIRQRGEIDVQVMGARNDEPSASHGQRVWLRGELQKRNYKGGNPIGMKVSWPRYCVGLSNPRFSLMAWCEQWRESAAKRLDADMEGKPEQRAILRSLILGYRNEIPDETYACFQRTGSLHVFAISGLHVGIIGLLLAIVLKSFGVPRDRFGVCMIPLLFAYVAASGMKASALRAMLMAGVFLLAPFFRRKPDIPSSVAFAAIMLLLLNPIALQSVGFIFSFVVVAFIVMVYSILPERLLSGGWIKTYIYSLVITSLAASLASIPMTTYYFGRFSPIALVGNLAVVPLTFCIILSGWLSIIFPFASGIFNHASVVFIDVMVSCVRWLDQIPGSSIAIESPPAAAIVLWYGSIVYLLTHATSRRQRVYGYSGALCSVLWTLLFVATHTV